MRVRVPGWLQSAPAVKLNGKTLDASATPGSYIALNRSWKPGDRIDLEFPMRLRVESMPDKVGYTLDDVVALLRRNPEWTKINAAVTQKTGPHRRTA